jgi:hypothetical protein
MGYACPVCDDPQADEEHLANHLAFTGMLTDEAHEAWLNEHAPGWEQMNPEQLAGEIVDDVPEKEFPQVFEDTTDDRQHDHSHGGTRPQHQPGGPSDEEVQEIMDEARELTEEMREDEGEADDETT